MEAKEILEKSIVAHKEAIVTAERELAELDKPKLRHGDYGVGVSHVGDKKCRLYIKGEIHNEHGIHKEHGITETRWNHSQDVWFGNIFDDLKRNSEDLRKFKVKLAHNDSINVIQRSDEGIEFEATNKVLHMTPDQAIEIGQNLIQLAYEVKRKG